MWLDLKGPILTDAVFVGSKLAAKDVAVVLPAVTLTTADFRAMGTLTLPIIGQIEAMEATITKVGIDMGLRDMIRLEAMTFEFRWMQDVKAADGNSKSEGCKAFIRGIPKGIPGLTIDPGTSTENDVTLAVTRYQLYVGGTEYWLIDQLNQILRVAGKDYAKGLFDF